MNLASFKVFSFDCYGTLIDWESGILAALRQARGGDLDVVDDVALARYGEAEEAVQSEHPAMLYRDVLREVYLRLADALHLDPGDTNADAFANSIGDWEPFADSVASLAYLREHYRLAVLSNVDKQSFARTHQKLGDPFDYIFTAEEIGSYKPDLRNFQYLIANLEKDGIRQDELLHVAQSRYHDIVPARSLGICNVWINRRHDKAGEGATLAAGEAKPDLEVKNLAELVDLHRRSSA